MKIGKSTKSFLILLTFVIVLVSLGIGAIVNAYLDTRGRLDAEHQERIYALGSSAEKSFANQTEQSEAKIAYIRTLTKEAEETLFRDGNNKPMAEIFQAAQPLKSDSIADLLLVEGNKVLLSLDPNAHNYYVLRGECKANTAMLCENEYGKRFLALLYPAATEHYLFAVIIDVEKLNDIVVGKEVSDDFWLLFYCPETDLWVVNNEKEFDIFFLGADSAAERQDGYTFLAESEKEGKSIATIYDYLDGNKKKQTALYVTIPRAETRNRLFAVGVAEEAKIHVSALRAILWKTIFASMVIMFGIFHLVFYLWRSHKSTRILEHETELLREQVQAKQELLDKTNELMHRQRLETIGTLTAGIAHEFNNLLTPIMGYSILSMEQVGNNEELMSNLNTIYESSSRAKSLITRLSQLSRKNTEDSYSLLCPDKLILDVKQMVDPSLPDNVEFVCDLHCPEAILYANETQMTQLCLNIIVNGIHAMKERGGILKVETGYTEKNVIFRFSDMGTGIPEEVLPHLFVPFFTTKEKGHGTGLGLAIVKRIVDDHGGTISVDSKTGFGTTFTVVLPNSSGKKETTRE